jgi:type IV pilus assembly protein PilA
VKRQEGFTLVELLVVVLVIGILAVIAIPLFIRQREKAEVADIQSVLKNAAIAIDSYAVVTNGNYSNLDGADSGPPTNAEYDLMVGEGFRKTDSIHVAVEASSTAYCVTTTASDLPVGHTWKQATYNSADGYPTPSDVDLCP